LVWSTKFQRFFRLSSILKEHFETNEELGS